MAKKARKKFKELDFDPYDEFDDALDEELHVKELSKDTSNGGWDDNYDTEERFSARRKIDGSTSITHLDKFLPEFKNGYDVVIGSRDIEGAFVQIHQAKYKEILGDMGNWAIRIVLGLWNYPDTQCGFKILSEGAAQEVAKRMVIDRFGFDYELIILAEKLGFKVKQMPVRWLNEEGSTVTLFGRNGYVQVFIDLFKTKWRLLTGKYNLKKA